MATATWRKYSGEKLEQATRDRMLKTIDELQNHFTNMQGQKSRPEGAEFYRGAAFAMNELKTSLHI